MFTFLKSWKTTLTGLAVVVCAVLPVVGVPTSICAAVATICSGLGLIAAKDGNVTGDGTNKESTQK